jgi:hypothetical protein
MYLDDVSVTLAAAAAFLAFCLVYQQVASDPDVSLEAGKKVATSQSASETAATRKATNIPRHQTPDETVPLDAQPVVAHRPFQY